MAQQGMVKSQPCLALDPPNHHSRVPLNNQLISLEDLPCMSDASPSHPQLNS
ncbi:hypothetical protein COCNU_07G004880 [Cocos nucifera]|uniref:Uncharacterized protein n=1 Tax=Cocos nucifera TaxID=13894 RepID=A0A8K0IE61_COCNU|nr:hypothetical protein COCNU_07G004880 [Cocos nucifera]